MAKGPRDEKDPSNVNGSGYSYDDMVMVDDGETGNPVKATIHAIHADGKSVDVRYDQKGHKLHNAVRKVSVDAVSPFKAKE